MKHLSKIVFVTSILLTSNSYALGYCEPKQCITGTKVDPKTGEAYITVKISAEKYKKSQEMTKVWERKKRERAKLAEKDKQQNKK